MSYASIKLRKEISKKADELLKLLSSYEEFCSDEDGDIDVSIVYDYSSTLYDLMNIFDRED